MVEFSFEGEREGEKERKRDDSETHIDAKPVAGENASLRVCFTMRPFKYTWSIRSWFNEANICNTDEVHKFIAWRRVCVISQQDKY